MGKFTNTTNHNVTLQSLEIPKNGTLRVHLVDVKARVSTDITLVKSDKVTATIKSSPFDGPNGIWVVDIKAVGIGKTTLEAKFNNTSAAKVDIKTFNKIMIQLPRENTEEGMLTRLFLAESVNPSKPEYNAEQSKKSMLWMRKVIDNRLTHKTPNIFGAKKRLGKTSYDVYDIIMADNQFHGFDKYPTIIQNIKFNISTFLTISNDYTHSKRELYAEYIKNATAAAAKDALKNVIDPSQNGLYGWKTKGANSPGGNFKEFQHFAGQTFYTLR